MFVGTTVAVLVICGLFAYRLSQPFREEVDDLYYSTYANVVVDPVMTTIADRITNVAYCGTTNLQQMLDVYTPKQNESAQPTVIYIHGGGWSSGNKANSLVTDYGAEIVKGGLSFVSINYRLAPAYRYPAQNQDVNCAIRYLVQHAASLHINMDKVGLFGDSAGAELAAMTALTSPDKARIKAVVELYGPSDIWAQITRKPRADQWAINYIGNANNQALAQEASPLYANLAGAPPFLLFHGINDQTVHYDQSVNFSHMLQRAGVHVTLVPVTNANHSFGASSMPNRNAIESQTVQFFTTHLKP